MYTSASNGFFCEESSLTVNLMGCQHSIFVNTKSVVTATEAASASIL
jgi:hypothetical protein